MYCSYTFHRTEPESLKDICIRITANNLSKTNKDSLKLIPFHLINKIKEQVNAKIFNNDTIEKLNLPCYFTQEPELVAIILSNLDPYSAWKCRHLSKVFKSAVDSTMLWEIFREKLRIPANLSQEEKNERLLKACKSNSPFSQILIVTLVQLGADVNIRDKENERTPLHIVAKKLDYSVMNFLLCKGANWQMRARNADWFLRDQYFYTPISEANIGHFNFRHLPSIFKKCTPLSLIVYSPPKL